MIDMNVWIRRFAALACLCALLAGCAAMFAVNFIVL